MDKVLSSDCGEVMVHVIVNGIGDMSKAIESVHRQTVHCDMIVSMDGVAQRRYAAYGLHRAFSSMAHDNTPDTDVVAILDGDDELNGNHALEPVVAAYRNDGTWVTHGSYEKLSGDKRTFNGPYRPKALVRKSPWRASHLKTFRYGLFKHLSESVFKGPDGEWLKVCSDTALMFALIELAGLDRTRWIKQVIYRYNDQNPENDHKVRPIEQQVVAEWLRKQTPYTRLEKL